MAFRQTPQLGPQLNQVGPFHYDPPNITDASPKLGTKEDGNDGHVYILVKASANISATASTGTQVSITEPAMTAAAGSGGFYTPPDTAITSGQVFWARKGAL